MSNTEIDLKDSLWAKVSEESFKFKHQACPRSLVAQLIADVESRGGRAVDVTAIDDVFIDCPGMIMTDRSVEKIRVDTLSIEMPSEDFSYFRDRLKSSHERRFEDGSRYYKIHGWLWCIVFTPEQRSAVLDVMDEMAAEADERAKEDHVEFMRRLDLINKDKTVVISTKDERNRAKLSGNPTDDLN